MISQCTLVLLEELSRCVSLDTFKKAPPSAVTAGLMDHTAHTSLCSIIRYSLKQATQRHTQRASTGAAF